MGFDIGEVSSGYWIQPVVPQKTEGGVLQMGTDTTDHIALSFLFLRQSQILSNH